MSVLNGDRLKLTTAIAFMLLLLAIGPKAMAQPCAVSPASGSVAVLPNVLVIFDNSGSMTQYAYNHASAYSSSTTYAGIFDSGKRYSYNNTSNYFYENDPGGVWSGNFLNWACMLRIDVSRKVMTGGKVTDAGGNKYITANNFSMDAPEYTYNDTSGQTPWTGNYQYRYLSNTSYEWGQLRVRNMSDVTQATYNIRILVSADYVARGILHNLEGKVRLGLMHFNGDREGGYIRRFVQKLDSTQLNNIVSDLNRDLGEDYDWSYTPLAETLYNATRYFSQDAPYYHPSDYAESRGTYPNDPLYQEGYGLVRCAKNYVVLLTDGESTEDLNIPSALQDYDGDGCDNPGPCNCPGYSCTNPLPLSGSAYLDDIAKYAYTTDLRGADQDNLPETQNLTLHAVYMFGQPGWADVLLKKAAEEKGGGKYFLAAGAAALTTALQAIFEQITQQAAAAASTAITSEPVSGVDLIYVPYFKHPQDDQWWGNIRAFRMGADGSLLAGTTGTVQATDVDGDLVLDNPKWDAAAKLQTMDKGEREIFTYISNSKQNFVTSNGALDKYFDVDLNNDTIKDGSAEADALISYIRGNDSVGFSVRGRMNNYLGDIMHASPAFVGKPAARYDLIYGDTSYWSFFWTNASRAPVLYAGTNDGMLHCFDADNGEERWSYIPYNLLPHLKWLAASNYCHSYYVDLSANVWDMKLGSNWKSVLVGGMRIGGTPIGVDHDDNAGTPDITLRSALFALDVTDPDPADVSVLWEMNDDRFGYTTSKPIPVKVGSNWYLVFGSGPRTRTGEGGSTGDGYVDTIGRIFVVDPNGSGSIPKTFELGGTWGPGNFFGSPVAIDYDLDYSVDMIYIGDAKGNLWRIKTFTIAVDGTKTYQSPSSWSIDVNSDDESNPEPLLSLGPDQPILIKPAVTMDEKGRVWIYFGTGRYYCANDNNYCADGNVCPSSGSCLASPEESVGPRSKYMAVGIYDRHWYNDTVNPENSKFVLQGSTLGTGNLDHRVIKRGTVVGSGDTGYYVVDYTTGEMATDVSANKNGWYFRLLEGRERSLGDFLIYQGAIFCISFTPDVSDPCTRGGLSNLYGVYYTSGTSTANPIFDLTGEGAIDSDDLVRDGSNKRFGPAMMKLDKGFAGGSLKVKGTKGYTPLPDEALLIAPPGDEYQTGITSWREVLQ